MCVNVYYIVLTREIPKYVFAYINACPQKVPMKINFNK